MTAPGCVGRASCVGQCREQSTGPQVAAEPKAETAQAK